MNKESRRCQNCHNEFWIESEDFQFYEKMKVPPPTWCPECRFQRRLMFRNERVLYKRKCDLCGESMVTVFSPEKPFKVYCSPCWWSDKWDASEYAMDYDPGKNFFDQYKEFQKKVPFMNLFISYSTLVNSDYTNHAGYLKNCYLVFNADYNENVYYGVSVNKDKDSMDALRLVESELCYEVIMSVECYRAFFSEDCRNCTDVYFSKALRGCSNCFGCINLQNKSYYIFNRPYSKEDYKNEIKKFKLDSFSVIEELKKRVREFWLGFPNKFMVGAHNVNVSGDYIAYSKNAHHMYQARGVENGKFCQWITLEPAKEIYDLTEWGNGVELVYDSIAVGEGANNIKFSFGVWDNTLNIEYSMFATNCSNVFGCLNLKKKQYCIFNKQYSKEEYEALRVKIIEDMNSNPYIDSKGRVFKYGEFFPYDLSLFGYNETSAIQLFPLIEEKVLEKGWRWEIIQRGSHEITMASDKIPNSIHDVDESILQEILGCASCGRPFKMVRGEYELLKRFGFPSPRKCPDCRHMERMGRINPPRLWIRKCDKCGSDMQISYAPDRKEIVYCEQCYQQEVV